MYSRAAIEAMKERASAITKNDVHAIVGKRPEDIIVLEACGKVCIDIHMGEDMPEEAVRYTYRLLKLFAERLGTDLLELTLTAENLLQCDEPAEDEDCSGRKYQVGDVVLRPTISRKSAYLNLVRVTKITATSITVGDLDGSGGVRLQRPTRALIVGKVK